MTLRPRISIILGLVYLISFFSKSFVLPLAVGILGFVIAQLLRDYGIDSTFFPFSWPVSFADDLLGGQGFVLAYLVYSLVFFGIITLIGLIAVNKDHKS